MYRLMAAHMDSFKVVVIFLVFYQSALCLVSSVHGLSSQELCESKVCSGCIAGSLSCQEGGLNRLPDVLSPDIQSIFMIGHKFDSPILLRDNFSGYPQQTAQLQRMTIRNCGIEVLQPGAFFDLQSVKQLDLSQNRLRIIEPATFAGLRLELLRLDENTDLRLSPGAFRDASIVSLSMNQCGLSTLSYHDLAPLMSMGALKNLHLSGNKLFTFDGRLETAFLSLQSLSLENNPFTCDCRINWLADVLQRRKVKRQTRALESADPMVNSLKPIGAVSALDGDLLKPVCRAPARLVGRPLDSLSADDFYCEPPRLKTLEVDLGHAESKRISGDPITNENGLAIVTGSRTPLVITLRCHIEGSPEMDLSWYQRINLDSQLTSQLGFFDGLEKLTKLPGSVNPKKGVAEIALSSPSRIRDLSRSISSLPLKTRLTEQFVCYGTDPSGSNATAEVRLHWPLETPSDQVIPKSSVVEGSSGLPGDRQLKEKTGNNANSGMFILSDSDVNGFWLQPQYSAIQMISAVVGTFLVTCILFLLGCCLLKAHHRHQDKVRTKILLNNHTKQYQQPLSSAKLQQELRQQQHQHQQQQQQQTPITSLPIYSTTIPSAAQESALASLLHPNGSQPTAFANQLAYQLSGNPPGNNGVSSPMVNGLPPLVTTYEPVTLSETITSTTYSDSQTYDLPQHPPQIQPPLPPLPPKTGGFVMATQRPVSVNHHGTINAHLPFIFTPLPNDPKTMGFNASSLLPPLLVNASIAQHSHTSAGNTASSATTISNGSTFRAMAVNANTLSRPHKQAQVPGTPCMSGTMGHQQNITMPPNHVFNLAQQRQKSLYAQSLRDVT